MMIIGIGHVKIDKSLIYYYKGSSDYDVGE